MNWAEGPTEMEYEYISWNRFYHLCGRLYRGIADSGYRPDIIIAIARGGYPVGRVLADYFGLMDLISLKIEHYHGPEKMARTTIPYPLPLRIDGRRVLLVDDVSDSGDTFDAACGHLRQHGSPDSLRTAVLHHKQTSIHRPDYHAQRVIKWRWITYPWALVEDLTALAARMTPPPGNPDQLIQGLPKALVREIPARVMRQVAPIVLERLAD